MTKSKEQLLNIWFNVWQIPGWLKILEMTKDYDQEDLACLEEIDENAIAYEQEAQKEYWAKAEKTRKKIEEFKNEFPPEFKKERRMEYLTAQIEGLQKRLTAFWTHFQEMVDRDLPHWLRTTVRELSKPWLIEGKIRNLNIEKYLLEHPEDFEKVDRITPEQVARALEFPFRDLVQLSQQGFALCPFHKEKRASFYVKNNWGYCFGCQWHGDTIQFVRDRDNLSFKQAVKLLCR